MNAAPYSGWEQSLADGAPGLALPLIARARAGLADWAPVHRLAKAMTSAPVQAHPRVAGLFYGAPAVAYALHTAQQPAYGRALATLDRAIDTLIRARLDAAHRRMDNGRLATAREYDLIGGITGLGTYLLHRRNGHELLREVLTYLVELTSPIRSDGETLPGWWATGSPDRRQSSRWNGGHAGLGMAHGISGPLALLSIAMQRGVTVHGHHDAIRAICTWLDQWRSCGSSPWWPEVIGRDEHRNQTLSRSSPHRPSWCYGTPGIARAQLLAGQALHTPRRTRTAEQALLGCLTDDRQLAQLTAVGLCHGWVGLIHTCRRIRAETGNTELATAINAATDRLQNHLHQHGPPEGEGFLEGRAGLKLLEDDRGTPSHAVWDACLLTNNHTDTEGAT